jgi:hypothetical protein
VSAEQDKEKGDLSLDIKQSFADKNGATKPAQFSITWPEEGEKTAQVDLGVNVSFILADYDRDEYTELTVTGERHYNNTVDKEQDSILGTVALLRTFNVGETRTGEWELYPQLKATYKNDRTKGTDSFIGAALLELEWLAPWGVDGCSGSKDRRGWDKFRLGSDLITHCNANHIEDFAIQITPQLGVQYEDVYDAPEEEPTGSTWRNFGSVSVNMYPWWGRLNNNDRQQAVVLTTSYSYWGDFSEDAAIDTDTDTHTLFKASVAYYFIYSQEEGLSAGLALEYVDGEDPEKGFVEQSYTKLGLVAGYTFKRTEK